VHGAELWFATAGGMAAWVVHLGVAWSVMEVGCLDVRPTEVLQRGAPPPSAAVWVVYAATLVPWLVSVAACLDSVWILRRLRRSGDDVLARERTHLLVVMGILLDLFAVAAITGGAVGLMTLKACG
jgi:hypothetical protein